MLHGVHEEDKIHLICALGIVFIEVLFQHVHEFCHVLNLLVPPLVALSTPTKEIHKENTSLLKEIRVGCHETVLVNYLHQHCLDVFLIVVANEAVVEDTERFMNP